MRELLLAFILALIVGSILNGMPPAPKPSENNKNSTANPSSEQRSDFPSFASITSVNEANFNDLVLASSKPVLIYCYSPNNLPSEQMIPIFSAVVQEHSEPVKFVKLNVIENALLSNRYEIYAMPTFLLFSQGKLAAQMKGIVPKDQLEGLLTPYLVKASI